MNYKKVFVTYKLEIFIFVGILLAVVFTLLFIFAKFHPPESYDNNGLPKGFVTYKFVHSRSEGVLYYPNAKVFSLTGSDQHFTESGWAGAWSGAILTTSDSETQVYEWYNTWLLTHGWQENKRIEAIHINTQSSAKAYTRGGREVFNIAIDKQKSLSETLGKRLPSEVTIFEMTYYVNPYSSK